MSYTDSSPGWDTPSVRPLTMMPLQVPSQWIKDEINSIIGEFEASTRQQSLFAHVKKHLTWDGNRMADLAKEEAEKTAQNIAMFLPLKRREKGEMPPKLNAFFDLLEREHNTLIIPIPETVYENTITWENENQRPAFHGEPLRLTGEAGERAFKEGMEPFCQRICEGMLEYEETWLNEHPEIDTDNPLHQTGILWMNRYFTPANTYFEKALEKRGKSLDQYKTTFFSHIACKYIFDKMKNVPGIGKIADSFAKLNAFFCHRDEWRDGHVQIIQDFGPTNTNIKVNSETGEITVDKDNREPPHTIHSGHRFLGVPRERFSRFSTDEKVWGKLREDLIPSLGGRQLIFSAQRSDPTKGVLEALTAYEKMLDTQPELAGQVIMIAGMYGANDGPEYIKAREDAVAKAKEINAKYPDAVRIPERFEQWEMASHFLYSMYFGGGIALTSDVDGLGTAPFEAYTVIDELLKDNRALLSEMENKHNITQEVFPGLLPAPKARFPRFWISPGAGAHCHFSKIETDNVLFTMDPRDTDASAKSLYALFTTPYPKNGEAYHAAHAQFGACENHPWFNDLIGFAKGGLQFIRHEKAAAQKTQEALSTPIHPILEDRRREARAI